MLTELVEGRHASAASILAELLPSVDDTEASSPLDKGMALTLHAATKLFAERGDADAVRLLSAVPGAVDSALGPDEWTPVVSRYGAA